jgi:predicted RecA/RadA family phage recombinase
MAFSMQVKSFGDQTDGMVCDYTPAGAVSGEDVVILSSLMIGVATNDIAASQKGAIQIVGVRQFPQAAVTITAGERAYLDEDGNPVNGTPGTGAVTDVAAGNIRIGHFVASSASTDSFATVYFCPCAEAEAGS